jgi:hypothetical protein
MRGHLEVSIVGSVELPDELVERLDVIDPCVLRLGSGLGTAGATVVQDAVALVICFNEPGDVPKSRLVMMMNEFFDALVESGLIFCVLAVNIHQSLLK